MQDFQGKVAVITGGASGFGREFARTAAGLGMKLVLADIEATALEATAAELRAQGAQVLTRRTDVSKAAELQALADATLAEFGAVHLLFNNAGVADGGAIWEASEADWNWVLGVNLNGVINGIRAFTPLMLAAAAKDPNYQAHIVNTASMAGLGAAPTLGMYCVSKHAVLALSEVLWQELDLVSPQVNCSVLCPWFVPTGIANSQRNRADARPANSGAQAASQGMLDKGMTDLQVSAEDVSRMTFDAIRAQRFYVFTHPQAVQTGTRARFEAILGMDKPVPAFADQPELRAAMAASLKPARGA